MFEFKLGLVEFFKFLPVFLQAFLVSIVLFVSEELFEIALSNAAGGFLSGKGDLLGRWWDNRRVQALMTLSFQAVPRVILLVLEGPLFHLGVDPAIMLLPLLH